MFDSRSHVILWVERDCKKREVYENQEKGTQPRLQVDFQRQERLFAS